MKILIFSLNTGQGHNTAARAVCDALIEAGARAEVCDAFALISPALSRAVCAIYSAIARHFPRLFGLIYRRCCQRSRKKGKRRKSLVYFVLTRRIGRLFEYIRREQPDAIITTHVFVAQQLTHLRRHGLTDIWMGGILTDYDAQPFWNETELERIFTPCDELSKALAGSGIPPRQLIAAGIPVDISLSERRDLRAARRNAGLDPDRRHVVIAGGGMGAGKMPGTIRALMKSLPDDVTLIAVCGNNLRLFRRLTRLNKPQSRLQVRGYARPLHALVRAADVFISKPGALSGTEAFALRVPFIAAHPIRGLEENNAAFFRAHGVALCPESDEQIAKETNRLLGDPVLVRRMQSAQRRLVPHCASRKIAAIVLSEAKKRIE